MFGREMVQVPWTNQSECPARLWCLHSKLYLLFALFLLLSFHILILVFPYLNSLRRRPFLAVDGENFVKPWKRWQCLTVKKYIPYNITDFFLCKASTQSFKQPLHWFCKQQHRKVARRDSKNFSIFRMAGSVNPEIEYRFTWKNFKRNNLVKNNFSRIWFIQFSSGMEETGVREKRGSRGGTDGEGG